MAHAESKIIVRRPIEEVFAFVLDGTNNAYWRPGVLDIKKLTRKELGVGSRFRQGVNGPTGRVDADFEIVECDEPYRIKVQVTSGPVQPTALYRFKEVDGGTEVYFSLDYRASGVTRLMEPMIDRQFKVEVAAVAKLKEYLESK